MSNDVENSTAHLLLNAGKSVNGANTIESTSIGNTIQIPCSTQNLNSERMNQSSLQTGDFSRIDILPNGDVGFLRNLPSTFAHRMTPERESGTYYGNNGDEELLSLMNFDSHMPFESIVKSYAPYKQKDIELSNASSEYRNYPASCMDDIESVNELAAASILHHGMINFRSFGQSQQQAATARGSLKTIRKRGASNAEPNVGTKKSRQTRDQSSRNYLNLSAASQKKRISKVWDAIVNIAHGSTDDVKAMMSDLLFDDTRADGILKLFVDELQLPIIRNVATAYSTCPSIHKPMFLSLVAPHFSHSQLQLFGFDVSPHQIQKARRRADEFYPGYSGILPAHKSPEIRAMHENGHKYHAAGMTKAKGLAGTSAGAPAIHNIQNNASVLHLEEDDLTDMRRQWMLHSEDAKCKRCSALLNIDSIHTNTLLSIRVLTLNVQGIHKAYRKQRLLEAKPVSTFRVFSEALQCEGFARKAADLPNGGHCYACTSLPEVTKLLQRNAERSRKRHFLSYSNPLNITSHHAFCHLPLHGYPSAPLPLPKHKSTASKNSQHI